jgi:hypothetical protein
MMQRLLSRLLVPFTVVLIGLGLWQVGGPDQARIEQRDDRRLNDLRALASHLVCLERAQTADDCGIRPRDTDRFTGEPFAIREEAVCAHFEQPDRLQARYPEELTDGCVRLR